MVVAEAPRGSAVTRVKVTFVLPICDAKQLSLSGDFNGWSPDATPMKRHDDGRWETTVDLAPGRYEYKFVRDGEWILDLLAHEHVWNYHGTLNSVIAKSTRGEWIQASFSEKPAQPRPGWPLVLTGHCSPPEQGTVQRTSIDCQV